MQERVKALEDSKMIEKKEKRAKRRVRFEDDQVEAAGGEASSQVLEERPDAVPLSPTGKEMWPGKERRHVPQPTLTVLPPCDHLPEKVMHPNLDDSQQIPVAAVTTRAQAKRAREQEVADQEATDSSGVVLTPHSDPSEDEDITAVCEDLECDGEAAEKREDIIRRQDLQQQDPSMEEMLQAAKEPDAVFAIRDGILYMKKFPSNEDSEIEEEEDVLQSDQWVIVVPEPLRKTVIEAGHDCAGHLHRCQEDQENGGEPVLLAKDGQSDHKILSGLSCLSPL